MIRRRSGTSGARARGFALLAPIFLIVVIAALGVYIVTLTSTSNLSADYALRGNQAHFLARSGIQWAAANIVAQLPDATPAPTLAPALACNPSGSGAPVTVAPGAGPPDYQLTVSCVSATQFTEGATQYYVYEISATATHGASGQLGYVSRTVVSTLRGCRTNGNAVVTTCL